MCIDTNWEKENITQIEVIEKNLWSKILYEGKFVGNWERILLFSVEYFCIVNLQLDLI